MTKSITPQPDLRFQHKKRKRGFRCLKGYQKPYQTGKPHEKAYSQE